MTVVHISHDPVFSIPPGRHDVCMHAHTYTHTHAHTQKERISHLKEMQTHTRFAPI